jgi:hypothetical protein
MTHACLPPVCARQVSADQLMCREHWYMVPNAIRTAVWVAWQDGAGAGTAQHRAAIEAARRSVAERLARDDT